MIIPNLIATAAAIAQSIAAPPTHAPAPGISERTRPIGGLAGLFSADDYPGVALRQGAQGAVGFRLTVSRDGRVSRCDVTGSSGSASLDSSTCAILQRRARFEPARDAGGKPVEDLFSGRIRWELPEPEPLPVKNLLGSLVF
ncbi:MAG: energy transducer TonB [Pseudomonadota bacterium]|nr:energy transducer TonB [Pseudomonadota bacterium]